MIRKPSMCCCCCFISFIFRKHSGLEGSDSQLVCGEGHANEDNDMITEFFDERKKCAFLFQLRLISDALPPTMFSSFLL